MTYSVMFVLIVFLLGNIQKFFERCPKTIEILFLAMLNSFFMSSVNMGWIYLLFRDSNILLMSSACVDT